MTHLFSTQREQTLLEHRKPTRHEQFAFVVGVHFSSYSVRQTRIQTTGLPDDNMSYLLSTVRTALSTSLAGVSLEILRDGRIRLPFFHYLLFFIIILIIIIMLTLLTQLARMTSAEEVIFVQVGALLTGAADRLFIF